MAEEIQNGEPLEKDGFERRWRIRYSALTLALFIPLLWAFISVRNLYPVAASTMMMSGGEDLQRGGVYYILRGETESGETIDIAPIELSDALTGRIWGLVNSTIKNRSFRLRWPHPENAALIAAAGGAQNVQRAARLPDLLRTWGGIYNSRLPQNSPLKLKAIRLDAYSWDGKSYTDYGRYIESWRAEL